MITDFIFDGKSLSEFGYIPYYEGLNEEPLNVSHMNYATIKAPNSDIAHKTSTNYEENYVKTFSIMKSTCDNVGDEFYLTNDDISELTKWLVRKEYKELKFLNTDDETDETLFYVQNTIDKVMSGDNCVGLTITMNSNAPYGFKPKKKIYWDTVEDTSITLKLASDEEGYIYPDMVITMQEACDLMITNDYEERVMNINNVKDGEVITIKGGHILQISSSDPSHDLSTDFNYNFLRLCYQYEKDENELRCSNYCTIEMEYQEIRKVGM